jgi:hypothetical protein
MGGAVSAIGDIGQSAIDATADAGRWVDQTVRQDIPGGWTTVALVGGGFYYAPEMGAWVDPATGEAVATSNEVAAADTASGVAGSTGTGAGTGEALSGIDMGGVGAAPNSLAGAGTYGAVPEAVAGTGAVTGGYMGAGAGAAASGLGGYATPLAIAGSSLLGANAAKSAAETQANAQNQANQLQYKMWQEQQALQEPWRQTGINALAKLNSGDVSAMMDPGYAFRLSEGQKALDRQAAARGGLISGGALKAATKYGQDMGSQEYTNAFNRYATLAGYGQNATNTLTNAAGNAGANIGAGITSAGAANAAGGVGAANALASGVGQYLNYSSNQDLTNAIRQSAYTKAGQ